MSNMRYKVIPTKAKQNNTCQVTWWTLRVQSEVKKIWDYKNFFLIFCFFINELENTTCHAGLLLTPTEGLAGFFLPFWQKKRELIMLFWHIFGDFWCLVVTLVTFSSNFSNIERNPKKKQKKILKGRRKKDKFLKSKKMKQIQKKILIKKNPTI